MMITQQETPSSNDQLPECISMRIVEVELGEPLPIITAFDEKKERSYRRARCLIRLHTQPLGLIELDIDKDELSPDEYAPRIWQDLSVQINEHLQQDDLPSVTMLTSNGLASSNTPRCIEEREQFLTNAPFASVIVPTHDRPDRLTRCLHSLLSLHYPHYEIIVVDNAPSTNATADLIKQMSVNNSKIRYVCEDRPGPSWARNCGIGVAKAEFLAFVDDDVIVDSYWLAEVVRAFSVSDKVACVTGLVLPLELKTPAQVWFEEYGGFSKGFSQRIFDMTEHHSKEPLYPYSLGRFGTGANMAFKAEVLRQIGGFDPALGGNGPARCGQDIASFFKAIVKGYQLVYVPASLVYHLHRPDYEGLRKQIYNYGVGLAAALTKGMLENHHLLLDFVVKVPYGLFFLLSARSPKNRKKQAHYPKELTKLELKGMVYGPLAYLRSRRAMYKLQDVFVPRQAQTGRLSGEHYDSQDC